MIESKFTFFQMQIEGPFVDPTESEEPRFCQAPEALNSFPMHPASHKFIFAMIDPEVFTISHIDQAIIPSPPIRIDHTVQGHLAPNHRLQRGCSAVGDQLGVDLPMALEEPKDDGFAVRPSPPFAFNRLRPRRPTASVFHSIGRCGLE